MCSSRPSFDSSLVLNEPGSSSTSPSRLPRMLVEYHPLRPSRWIVEHFAIAVAEDVGRIPSAQAEQTGFECRSQYAFDQGLPGLEILATDRGFVFAREFQHHR